MAPPQFGHEHTSASADAVQHLEKVGELVGNTNLPRYGEQLVIEFKKLQDENERLQNRF